MSDERAKNPTSIQVNVRMPPHWLEKLRQLAKMVTKQTGNLITAQGIIRESIKLAYGQLEQRYTDSSQPR